MKYGWIYGLIAILGMPLVACNRNQPESTPGKTAVVSEFNLDTLSRIYIAEYKGSDLRIVISYLSENHAVGYTMYKGLQRNLKGEVIVKKEKVLLALSEPGDQATDGIFKGSIDKKTLAFSCSRKSVGKNDETQLVLQPFLRVSPGEEEIEITAEKFVYFHGAMDSLGTFRFNDDGFCGYYPEITAEKAYAEAYGSWSIRGNQLFIDWRKNTLFPKQRSVFDFVNKDNNFSTVKLHGEGRTLQLYIDP